MTAATRARVRALAALAALAALGILGAGCRPALDDQPWLVSQPRIIGWKVVPAEAAPGAAATMSVIALDPAGPAQTTATAWTICHVAKPVGENRAVSPACLGTLPADAIGDPVQLTIPGDACHLFGPDPPQPARGTPPTRPRDPDATGGYYQPYTLTLGDAQAVGLQRVTCDLPDASLATARAFQGAYQPNQNPALVGLTLAAADGSPIDPAAVPAGTRLGVGASWLADSAETFPVFDRASATIVGAQETLAAAWFVTGGALAAGGAAATIADPATLSLATTWQVPARAGWFEIAFTLTDSRGGTDAARAAIVVVDDGP